MKKILIAYYEPVFAGSVRDALGDAYEVHSCHTGTDALAMIDELRPEGLILYLSLPCMDGLTVLKRCGYTPPAILALTDLADSAVLQAAADLGIGAVALIPCTVRHAVGLLEKLLSKEVSSPEG